MEKQEKLRKQIIAAAQYRFAVKKYDASKKIPQADWDTILEIARLSPSSFGWEPWLFLDIQNEDMRQEMEEFCWGAIPSLKGADHVILYLVHKNLTPDSDFMQQRAAQTGRDISEDSVFYEKFSHFQKIDFDLNTERALFDWASKQAYIPLANMMNAAAMLGVDSCAIEGFNRELLESYLVKKNIVDTQEFGVAVMASFGYRDMEQPEKKRQSLDAIYKVIT
ncbi:MAG: NAD(P)H-dependent oxidoreductase [Micrococcaceae bacterium]